jgi:hypothetical protein
VARTADHDREVALAILEPYFEAAREVYLDFASARGLDLRGLKKLRLECDPDMHDTPRHFAGAAQDGSVIVLAPQLVDLPEDTVAAIIAHEFGHILDFLNPGHFVSDMEAQALVLLRESDADEQRAAKNRLARVRQWEARDEHSVELTADLIAQAAIGQRIGYSGPCMLQGFGRGVSRPAKLR